MVLSRYYIFGIFVLAFLVFDSEFRADVDSFQLYLVVDFVPSQDADLFSSSVEMSKSSGRYLVDLNLWSDALVIASLGLATLGLNVGTAESFGIPLSIIQFCYLL